MTMISRVIIAEDHESANISVRKTLEEMEIKDVDHAFYCDETLQKIKIAKQHNQPYDLLITDLYFEADNHPQEITEGAELIEAARQEQPDLKVLVFSAEGRAAVIERLFSIQEIDGYVRKARYDARELKIAIQSISQHQRYFPRHLMQLIKLKNTYQFKEFDLAIITLLSEGVRQKEIPKHLAQKGIRPSGLSSVEKRLNHIREVLEVTNNEQLISFCKDMGII